MKVMSYTNTRNNLAEVMNNVNEDHEPVIIYRQNHKPAVLMSLEDFASHDETMYLMASPTNAKRLLKAIKDIEVGKFVERELIEL